MEQSSVQSLFNPAILAQYNEKIKDKLKECVIMTKCDYLTYMKPPTTFLNLYNLIDGAKELCTGVIPYAKSCLTACVIGDKQCEKYNILFLVDQKEKKTVGFVIVQKGECYTYPNMISIKLICSSFRGGGHILLGAVAWCIKASRYDQGIILDLAGGELNKRALTSYERFGFVKSEELRSGNCYPTGKGNLIMLLDLTYLEPIIIAYKVLGVESIPVESNKDEYVIEEPPSGNKRSSNQNVPNNTNNGPSKRRAIGGKRKTRRRTRYGRTITKRKN